MPKKKENKKTIFRRIGGRVVPITVGVGSIGAGLGGGLYTFAKTMGLSAEQEKRYQSAEKARKQARKARSGLSVIRRGIPTLKSKKRIKQTMKMEQNYLKSIRKHTAREAILRGGFKRKGRAMGKFAFRGTLGSVGAVLAGVTLIGKGMNRDR